MSLLYIQGGPKKTLGTFLRLFQLRDGGGMSNFWSGRRKAGDTRILKMGVAARL